MQLGLVRFLVLQDPPQLAVERHELAADRLAVVGFAQSVRHGTHPIQYHPQGAVLGNECAYPSLRQRCAAARPPSPSARSALRITATSISSCSSAPATGGR